MARVEGGCCLLSPDVMRLGPLRDDQRPGLPAPLPAPENFPSGSVLLRLGKAPYPAWAPAAARFLVGSSSANLVDLYHLDAPVCPEDSIASRHRLGFQSTGKPEDKNLLHF